MVDWQVSLLARSESAAGRARALDVLDGEPDICPDHPLLAMSAAMHGNLLMVPSRYWRQHAVNRLQKTECVS